MRLDGILLGLYFVTLVVIVLELSAVWALAVALLLILIISIVHKIRFEDILASQKKDREKKLAMVAETLSLIAKKLEDVSYNLDKHMFSLENRIDSVKNESLSHSEKQYRELAVKILELENRLNSSRKTVVAVFGNLDARVQKLEEERK